ncbi:hypothetical protein EV363DRAFT_1450808 [Boletus edulis]|nr:hypothetical protein EV363DRAFT_1450808 [Boletus edulis]
MIPLIKNKVASVEGVAHLSLSPAGPERCTPSLRIAVVPRAKSLQSRRLGVPTIHLFPPPSVFPSTVFHLVDRPTDGGLHGAGAKATSGLDGTSKITSPTNGTSAEVSYKTGVPTMISLEDATTSSMTMLPSLMDRQVPPPTGISENSTKTTSRKTMGINVSQLRKLFLPKLDKNAKGSMSPAEIEILRAQKKVTGGEIVDRRPNRLGSLAPMASALKRLELSGSSGSSPV